MKFKLVNPSDYISKYKYEKVTSPEIFVKGTVRFHPQGIFSEEIWPLTGDARLRKKAIIDLRKCGKFIHPQFLDSINKRSKILYEAITRKQNIVWTGNVFEKTDKRKEGFFGIYVIKWMIDNLDELKTKWKSVILDILLTYKEKVLIDSIFVLPPLLRDVIRDKEGKILSNPPINNYYRQLIRKAKKYYIDVDELLENPRLNASTYEKWVTIQKLIYQIYLEEKNMIKGKEGLIRQNILGKRVDFSGRAVVVGDPDLPHNTIGLPFKMGAKLFEPFIANYLLYEKKEQGDKLSEILKKPVNHNNFSGLMILYRKGHFPPQAEEIIKQALIEVVEKNKKRFPVIMKRDPALHRLSLQAFYVKFVEDDVIHVPPLATDPFNMDFDGDTAAIYVPITKEARREVRQKMVNSFELPTNGKFSYTPKQDVVLGIYMLTKDDPTTNQSGRTFGDGEPVWDYNFGTSVEYKGTKSRNKVITTVGRYNFNMILPSGIEFINKPIKKKDLKEIVQRVYGLLNKEDMAEWLTTLTKLAAKALRFEPIGISIDELVLPDNLKEDIANIYKHSEGLSDVVKGIDRVMKKIKTWLKNSNASLYYLIDSGARGSWNNIEQMLVSKGIIADVTNKVIKEPIKSSLAEGLDPQEIVKMGIAVVKGSFDRSYRTQISGYTSRKLNLASSTMVITEKRCKTNHTLEVKIEPGTEELYLWRYCKEFGLIDKNTLKRIRGRKIHLYSPIYCATKKGICQRCFGEFANLLKVKNVGHLSAQAVGERLNQLVMRTFHTGGKAESVEIPDIIKKYKKLAPYIAQIKDRLYVKKTLKVIIPFNKDYVIHRQNIVSVTQGLVSFVNSNDESVYTIEIGKENFGLDFMIGNEEDLLINEFNYFEIYYDEKKYKGSPIASIEIVTQDVSTDTKFVNELLRGEGVKTVNELYQSLWKYLKNYGILSVHVETVIANMIRNAKNKYIPMRHKPDEPYVIVPIESVPYYESALLGILFENMGKALENAVLSGVHGNSVSVSPLEDYALYDFDPDTRISDIFLEK